MAVDYGFLVMLQLLFIIDPPGRSLGIDAMMRCRDTPSSQCSPHRQHGKSRRLAKVSANP